MAPKMSRKVTSKTPLKYLPAKDVIEWNELSPYTCPEPKGCEDVYLLYDKPGNRPYGAQISDNHHNCIFK